MKRKDAKTQRLCSSRGDEALNSNVWQRVRLGDIAAVVNGYGFPEHLQGRIGLAFPFIKVSDMNAEGAEITVSRSSNTVDRNILSELRGRTYPPGTIIFPKVGGALLTNKKRILGVEAAFDNNVMGVVPREADPEWLYYWLLTVDLRTLANTQALPSIRQSDVANLELNLPPLAEQRRMAGRLREQLAAVAQARAAVQAQLDAAQALPAAHLRAVFKAAATKRWPRKRMDELCEIVASQVDPRLPEYGGLPHVSGENIESGLCRLVNVRTAAEDGMISGKYLFEPGDVLYSKLRPYLRKVAIAETRGLCSADMYPLRVNQNLLDPRFTAWMLLGEEFTEYAVGMSQRSRMPKLNREQLFGWDAPTPPLPEQRRIAANIDGEVTAARQLHERLSERLAALDHLPAALLREAFGGRS